MAGTWEDQIRDLAWFCLNTGIPRSEALEMSDAEIEIWTQVHNERVEKLNG